VVLLVFSIRGKKKDPQTVERNRVAIKSSGLQRVWKDEERE